MRRMLREMTAIDWLHWKAYMQLVPRGLEVESLLAASIAYAAWNIEVAKAQGSWDAAKRKHGSRPEFRPFHTFITRLGDMPDYAPPKREPGHGVFESMADYFESLGMKKVREHPHLMGRVRTPEDV